MKASHGLLLLLLGLSCSCPGSFADEGTANEKAETPVTQPPGTTTRGFYFEPAGIIREPVIPKLVTPKKKVPAHLPASRRPANVSSTSTATSAKTKLPTPGTAKSVPQSIDTQVDSTILPVSHKGSSTTGPLVVVAKLNKGGVSPKYKIGEKMQISVSAAQDCNILVFNYDSNNTLTQIFPNDYQQDSFVKAGSAVVIGGTDSPFDYEIAGSGGLEKIFVYAYPTAQANPISVAFSPIPHTPFRSANLNATQYRQLVNDTKVFFTREIKIVPKAGVQLASVTSSSPAPNKIELPFIVESK